MGYLPQLNSAVLTNVLLWSSLINVVESQCYSGGDIAASVLVPLILTGLVLAALLLFLWKTRKIVFCPDRKLIKTGEGNGSTGLKNAEACYSNRGFTDEEVPGDVAIEQGMGGQFHGSGRNNGDRLNQSAYKNVNKLESPIFSPTSSNSRMSDLKSGNHVMSTTSLDDTYINSNPEVVSVNLQSQDFIGLGFNIQGSMRDGIRVSQVHNRGPAIESGKITAGDKIQSVTISFENMVFEDALTILSYASPYPVKVTLEKNGRLVPDRRSASDLHLQLNHPIYRSQSLDALTGVGKDNTFKKKRNFSEMKSDSRNGGHPKIHSVQLSSCNEGDTKVSGDLSKWRDVKLPDMTDNTFSADADELFSEADKLFADAKRNAEKKPLEKQGIEQSSAGDFSFNTTADKTNTSFFDVTAGDSSIGPWSDTSLTNTLDDITISLNNSPEKDRKTMEDMQINKRVEDGFRPNKSNTDTDSDQGNSNSLTFISGNSMLNELGKDDRKIDYQEQIEHARDVFIKAAPNAALHSKNYLLNDTEAQFNQKQQEVEENVVPVLQNSQLSTALEFTDKKQISIEEDPVFPETITRSSEFDSSIEFSKVRQASDTGNMDMTEITDKLSEFMARDSSSVEASFTMDHSLNGEPVVEDNLEAIRVRRDSGNDKIFGASLRDSRPLLEDEVVLNDPVSEKSASKQYFTPVALLRPSSDDEGSSADEGEFRIASESPVEVSHDLSADDLKSFQHMMSDRATRLEATGGDIIQELRGTTSEKNIDDFTTRQISRASSYDVVLENTSHPIETRTGSFKSERKGELESSLDWSGKRLVRSGSFSEIPQDKTGEDSDWTLNNNNIEERSLEEEIEKYRQTGSEFERRSVQVVKTKTHADNWRDLSENNSVSSSRSSSPTYGEDNIQTSRKTYTVSTEQVSTPEIGQALGTYSFTVRTGSDGEESDSVA